MSLQMVLVASSSISGLKGEGSRGSDNDETQLS